MSNILAQEQCPLCLSVCDERCGENPALERFYLQCARCHLIFVPKAHHLSREEEKHRYDSHNNDPDDESYRNFLSKLTRPLEKHLQPHWRGLDFGCGPGPAIAQMLGKKVADIKIFDPFYFPDTGALERKYDFITCTEVIEHFNSPREGFVTLNNLLKSESSLLAVMTEVWQGQGPFDQWWYQKDPAHVSFYTRETFVWIGDWLGWGREEVHKNVVFFHKKAGR